MVFFFFWDKTYFGGQKGIGVSTKGKATCNLGKDPCHGLTSYKLGSLANCWKPNTMAATTDKTAPN